MTSIIVSPQPHVAQVQCNKPRLLGQGSKTLVTLAAAHPRQLRRRRCQPLRAKVEEDDDVIITSATADLADDAAEADPFGGDVSAWAEQELRAMDTTTDHALPPVYSLSFLWLDKNIAVAADQVFNGGQRSPMTEYFFWPKKDAWEELKNALESRPWISERDKVLLLNKATEVINFWQDEANKNTLDQAKNKFPDCLFLGA